MASLGHNRAMLVSTDHTSDDATHAVSGGTPVACWRILTLSPDRTIKSQRIPGPYNPNGMYGMQLERVGEVVVAYGGVLWGEDLVSMVPIWFMAVYSIDTGVWETIPRPEGSTSPTPSFHPYVFPLGDTLVVVRGSSDNGETWEWSLETREWTSICSEEVDARRTHA
ncbi:hypothetical protein KIPB_009206 [Kipferlia bialata]|uniref:Uncharacterized protein n=1 Tax=Kipferlia bialata TaxID=797122 RepID=A0A9K3GKG1_9EUKA|nr:hypothetical protein KIPB_009206 [Kipferlia bialata]|eukprot:g9206.t1